MESDQFSTVKSVISDPLRFKAKLAIGEDAYGTLRFKNKANDLYEVIGGAGTGVAVAKSGIVATYFFAPQGFLGLLGLGGTAVTPVGWVVAAAVLSGGAALGVRRYLRDVTGSRVTVIPDFINTPIDVLAISLFDLIAPLALKIADVDGHVSGTERNWISDYFVNEWGYDRLFVDTGCKLAESKKEEYSIKEVAETLAKYCEANPDCNYAEMTRGLVEFLKGVMEADGKIDEREEFAIAKIEEIFKQSGKVFSAAALAKVGSTVAESLRRGKESLDSGVEVFGGAARTGVKKAKLVAKTSVSQAVTSGKSVLGKILS